MQERLLCLPNWQILPRNPLGHSQTSVDLQIPLFLHGGKHFAVKEQEFDITHTARIGDVKENIFT